MFYKNSAGALSLAAQTSCYGTHWVDWHRFPITPDTTATWTRSTTVATVTCSGHNLKTTLNCLNVTVSSATAAIVCGMKSITVIDSNTFTFTCLNAGAVSGTLTFQPFHGLIAILMNEATAETASVYTIDSGNPQFTSTGYLYMPTVGDQITFETPYHMKGHVGFPIAEAAVLTATIGNYDITYQIDKNNGAGYSASHNVYYPRAGSSGSAAAYTFTVTDATGVEVGDYVWGSNLAYNTKVTDVTGNTITVDLPNLNTISGVVRFAHLPSETGIDADLGFKLKLTIKTSTANVTAIGYLYFFSTSTEASRAAQYPLDLVPLTLTGLKNPTEVRVFNAGTTTEIVGQESVTTGTFTGYIDLAAYPTVDISILSLGYQNTRLLSQALTSTGLTIPVQQQIDRQYLNP
jgi:hypothetical protein